MVLLLAFGLMAGPDGDYAFAAIRAIERTPAMAAVILMLMLVGRRFQGRPRAAARLASAGTSGSPQPRLGADERRDDQGRYLRVHPRGLRSARPRRRLDEPRGPPARRRHGGAGHSVRDDGRRRQARARLFHDREHRRDLRRSGPRPGVPRQRDAGAGGAGLQRRTLSRLQPHVVQEPSIHGRRRGPYRDRAA